MANAITIGKTTGLQEKYEEVGKLLGENPYMPVIKACEAVGMTRSMYYLYKSKEKGGAVAESEKGESA